MGIRASPPPTAGGLYTAASVAQIQDSRSRSGELRWARLYIRPPPHASDPDALASDASPHPFVSNSQTFEASDPGARDGERTPRSRAESLALSGVYVEVPSDVVHAEGTYA